MSANHNLVDAFERVVSTHCAGTGQRVRRRDALIKDNQTRAIVPKAVSYQAGSVTSSLEALSGCAISPKNGTT
jgi:hypothetical protein